MNHTLPGLLEQNAERFAECPALKYKQQGQWQEINYTDLWQRVRSIARGLAALGVKPGDRVALISENCPDWVACDFGITSAGAINVAMFPSLPAVQIEHILADSGAWLLIVGSKALLEKALVVRQTMPDLQIVTMDGAYPSAFAEATADKPAPVGLLTLSELMARGDEYPEDELQARRAATKPEDLASLVYTSGTSGEQKGVMLSHANFLANVRQCQQVLHFSPDDVLLSVLPLNHVYERTTGCYLPLACGAQVAYAESLRRLRENLQEIRPTILILVPRFFEVLHEAVTDRMEKAPKRQRGLLLWALAVGKKATGYRLAHRIMPPHLWAQWRVADSLVFSKLRRTIGLDRLKDMVSGAAALSLPDNEFFQAVGIEVLEGYGLTEAAPVVACNRPGQIKLACVGPALPGIEVTLGEADEILVRSENVMLGYWGKPDATAAALDDQGWLHTGDVGKLDENGYLAITDRLKDLLVLTSGKNVAPQPIENALRTSPYIGQAVVLGDREQYVTALIVPVFDRLKHWAKTQGLQLPATPEEMVADKAVQGLIKTEIERLTPSLADFERVRDFRLLSAEFTVEGGELTPTMKVKRRVVLEKYGSLMHEMYR
ncbi:MAG: AMP-dependent synthetase/ligase [Armatimonadota bacterium]